MVQQFKLEIKTPHQWKKTEVPMVTLQQKPKTVTLLNDQIVVGRNWLNRMQMQAFELANDLSVVARETSSMTYRLASERLAKRADQLGQALIEGESEKPAQQDGCATTAPPPKSSTGRSRARRSSSGSGRSRKRRSGASRTG